MATDLPSLAPAHHITDGISSNTYVEQTPRLMLGPMPSEQRKDIVRIHLLDAKLIILGAALWTGPLSAWANGYRPEKPSARYMARAGAVIATADDPSAIYYNPAGLTSTEGTELLAGITARLPNAEYMPNSNTEGTFGAQRLRDTLELLPHVFVSRRLSDKAFVGLGLYSSFNARYEWEQPDPSQAHTFVLENYYFAPTVALRISERFSVAIGVSIIPATLHITQPLSELGAPAPALPTEGIISLDTSAFGVSATAGFQLVPVKNLKLGLTFRSGVQLSFSGDVDVTFAEPISSDDALSVPRRVTIDIPLPHVLTTGIAWEQGPLTVEIGGEIRFWETFQDRTLELSEPDQDVALATPREWQNALTARVGAEYRFQRIAGRIGVAWLSSPVPDATLDWSSPLADQGQFTLGIGYDLGPLRVDSGYQGAFTSARFVPLGRDRLQPSGGQFLGVWSHSAAISLSTQL